MHAFFSFLFFGFRHALLGFRKAFCCFSGGLLVNWCLRRDAWWERSNIVVFTHSINSTHGRKESYLHVHYARPNKLLRHAV